MNSTVIWALSSGGEDKETFQFALEKAKERSACLVGLFIIDPQIADVIFSKVACMGFLGGKPSKNLHATILREYKDRAHRTLKNFEEGTQGSGVQTEAVLRTGEFAGTCHDLAKERGASLLILGELSKYSFYQFLKGQATVQELNRHAGCPVEIFTKPK
jgi:nucleotide-binding universal stress UspA family protein